MVGLPVFITVYSRCQAQGQQEVGAVNSHQTAPALPGHWKGAPGGSVQLQQEKDSNPRGCNTPRTARAAAEPASRLFHAAVPINIKGLRQEDMHALC